MDPAVLRLFEGVGRRVLRRFMEPGVLPQPELTLINKHKHKLFFRDQFFFLYITVRDAYVAGQHKINANSIFTENYMYFCCFDM